MSLSPAFENGLTKLSMLNSNEETTGLYFLDDKNIQNPQIKIYIEEAKKYNPTAIYVTKFENGTVKPQIYIYDNTSNQLTQREITEQHKRLWNAYKVPMFFVFTPTDVKVINCLQKPVIKEDGELKNITPLEIISLTSSINKEFKAQMFDSGAFWNSKYKNNFSFSNSVYKSLLDELKLLRENLIKKEILSVKTTESLLIKSILLRYLEERGVFDEEIKNKKPYWNKFKDGATSFTDLFDDNKAVVDLLDDLNIHFNGGVFDIGEEDSEERTELLHADLKEFQYFLKGTKEGKQLVLWSRYSFKDLPIELISNIYELFLKSEDKAKGGVVYTPPILVNFVIDEIMPLEKPQKDFKLIDPSCGSGIFLVGAYKRLIQWWMIENDWKRPSTTVARNIIKKSIYGVDKEEGAVQLSIFSLALVLCDTFLPKVIWNKLKFDNLKESGNVIAQDFFEYIQEKEYHNTFDLVIGNPPFVSGSDSKAFKQLEEEELKNRPKAKAKVKVNKREKLVPLQLPDKQLALFFLEQSFKLLKPNAYLSMIQHAPPFLYNHKPQEFRNYLFKKYQCHQVIDFSGLKKLFNTANVAIAVAFMQKKEPNIEHEKILHLTVRETFLEKEKKYFDLSHYDFHWLRYRDALEQKSIWKCNLMGGSRIRTIISRLSNHLSLGDYLKYKKDNSGWFYAEGFQIKGDDKYKENHTADYITGKPTMPPEAFTEERGIRNDMIFNEKETNFHRHRFKNKKIYEPPHLLIKEKLGKYGIISEYRDDYLTFRNDSIGIHAPLNEKKELLILAERLKKYSLTFLFYLITTSGRAGISKATSLLKKDLDLLPYPDDNKNLQLSRVEEYFANDTFDYMLNYIKNNNKNIPVLKDVTDEQLDEFQSVYCELLNSTYDDFKPLNSFETESFIGCSFYFKDKPKTILIENSEELDENLFSIINNKVGQNVNIKRILRFYDKNIIYIIKPKQYRFWLKSIAVRDADETFSDLVRMGY